MQDIKRETSGKRVPSGVEKTVANQQLMHQRERQLLRDHHAELRTIEQLLDVEASAAARAERNDDCGPAGPQGARLVGRKRSPAREEKDRSLHPVLARLEDAGDGWTAGAAATALAAGRCAIYSRATLGPGAGVIFSEAYGRQRTRNTSHVKVRWVGLSGEDEPYICRVEHYLLLTPPPACVAARAAAGVAAGAAASAAAGPLSPLRLAVVASFKAAPCGPAMWRANADAPAEGGRLWPVRLAEIDCRLLMAAPSKCLSRGELYGIEYTTLSRVG
ncbi:MAG: hypothetical protein J3K34DRAFT_409202 [Monoraphidium minutum]|nr:MAG: hypothetical protein J3K34DRAFT_409202 [Monoraphidium minutum]